jgi:hypothetical protein
MTPKDKAKELVEKYAIWSWNEAKQCALIAVDEILQIKSITMYPILEDNYIYGHEEYWQKVKQEIEKL